VAAWDADTQLSAWEPAERESGNREKQQPRQRLKRRLSQLQPRRAARAISRVLAEVVNDHRPDAFKLACRRRELTRTVRVVSAQLIAAGGTVGDRPPFAVAEIAS
jgi:hypothetical protein